jgi:hypothetical protein
MRVQVHVKTEETERLQAAVEYARTTTRQEQTMIESHRLREHEESNEHDDLTNGHSGILFACLYYIYVSFS